jgi:aryl-alcohol dehydrogenase-like predicted oxidoreductase
MRVANPVRLVLGCVQLGLAYGAVNRTGKPSHGTAMRLVHRAADAGIAEFDTARGYGDSEDRLGEALKGRCARIITKLSPLGDLPANAGRDAVRDAVNRSITQSLAALRQDSLACVLAHRAAHLTAFGGAAWERLNELKNSGAIRMLGVSVQSPAEAEAALEHPNVEHIQLPFNVLDWRWQSAGIPERIRGLNVTIHARSAFLQGLLATGDSAAWPAVSGVDPNHVIGWLHRQCAEFRRINAADLCLAYVRAQDWIDGVVVGVETEEQLEANLRLWENPQLTPQECSALEQERPHMPAEILDPARWPQ